MVNLFETFYRNWWVNYLRENNENIKNIFFTSLCRATHEQFLLWTSDNKNIGKYAWDISVVGMEI